jgi:type II secretory pathway pseudopilin PulG
MTTPAAPARGFSLVEVIVAIGMVAAVLVALLGWFAPAVRSAAATADAQVAAGLADEIQLELERLEATLGFDGLAAVVPATGAGAPLRLVATRDGRRVRCADAADPVADHALDDPAAPGIAWRDRYFLAEVVQSPDLPFRPGAGFLAVSVRVSWPYRVPVGPAAPGAVDPAGDPSREVPAVERRGLAFNYALRP